MESGDPQKGGPFAALSRLEAIYLPLDDSKPVWGRRARPFPGPEGWLPKNCRGVPLGCRE